MFIIANYTKKKIKKNKTEIHAGRNYDLRILIIIYEFFLLSNALNKKLYMLMSTNGEGLLR